MSRKVFVSFLGTSNYSPSHYYKDAYKSDEVRYVQEATLAYLHQIEPWTGNDVAYILLTDLAKKRNWLDDGHCDRNTHQIIKAPGLENCLRRCGLPMRIEPVEDLPDGNTEDEIWEIFNRVFEKIQDEDCLYFDITHGYRYLPMLVLVLGNYAKFLKKNVSIECISYGNYEGRNSETNESLIVDLLPLTTLQDWTFAAGQFLESGDSTHLAQLGNNAIRPLMKAAKGRNPNITKLYRFNKCLNDVTKEWQLCRGISIIEARNVRLVHESKTNMDASVVPPLKPILDRIQDSLNEFDPNENIRNAFVASKWCYEHGMYQQSATILQEFIVTFFCKILQYDWRTEAGRDVVAKSFTTIGRPEEEWWLGLRNDATESEREAKRSQIRKIHQMSFFEKFAWEYQKLSELRNDLNHSGMRNCPRQPDVIKRDVGALLDCVSQLLIDYENDNKKMALKGAAFINLSNHPSGQWPSEQAAAATAYGPVVDLPFPDVNPDGDEQYIAKLADEYLQKIWFITKLLRCS